LGRFFLSLKTELVPRKFYNSFNDAESAIICHITGYYSVSIKERFNASESGKPFFIINPFFYDKKSIEVFNYVHEKIISFFRMRACNNCFIIRDCSNSP
jgi:hypothetical protein